MTWMLSSVDKMNLIWLGACEGSIQESNESAEEAIRRVALGTSLFYA